MKVFIVLAAFVAVASANGYGASRGAGYGAGYGVASSLVPTGQSSQYRSEDNYGNYQFGYDESHAYGGSSRREEGSAGIRRGSYSLSDADGRRRTVNYVADHTGFHANVHTNEPGVEPKDPADVYITKDGYNTAAPVQAPAPAYTQAPAYAPAPVRSYAAAAPVRSYTTSTYAPVAQAYAAAPAYAPASTYSAAPAYAPAQTYSAPAPRAFSYSFGASHIAPVASYARAAPIASYARAAPVTSYAAPAAAYNDAAPAYGRAY